MNTINRLINTESLDFERRKLEAEKEILANIEEFAGLFDKIRQSQNMEEFKRIVSENSDAANDDVFNVDEGDGDNNEDGKLETSEGGESETNQGLDKKDEEIGKTTQQNSSKGEIIEGGNINNEIVEKKSAANDDVFNVDEGDGDKKEEETLKIGFKEQPKTNNGFQKIKRDDGLDFVDDMIEGYINKDTPTKPDYQATKKIKIF